MTRARPRRRNPFKLGSSSYVQYRRVELTQTENLAQGRADRAKNPEARRRALRQAAAARRGLRDIPKLEAIAEYRRKLDAPERRLFDSFPLAEKARQLEVEKAYPQGVPPDVPDPLAVPIKHRSASWRLYYATRAGFRHGRAG